MFAPENEKRGVQEEFDAKAAEYESNRLAGWYKAHNDIIASHLKPEKGDTLLDIGCGTGYLIRRMVTAHPGLTAIGVDLSPAMIDTARQKTQAFSDRVQVFNDDWEAPGPALRKALEQRRVNHAVCASVFHYFSDPVDALRRIRPCLADGGALFLLERRREGSLPTIAWDLAHRHLIRDHVRFYSSAEMLDIIGRAGFRQEQVVQTVRKVFWHNKISTNLTFIRAIR